MKNPKRLITALLLAVASATLINTSRAVPYASSVTNSAGTISFILNESADNVSVAFDNGTSTNNLGALAKGKYSFAAGASTNFQIVVNKAALAGWTQISSDQTLYNQFYSTRGIAVNMYPTNSAFFGRIYVANAIAGTTSATGSRPVAKGIYVLGADQSDITGRHNTAGTAGITFDNATGSPIGNDSPLRLEVGQNGMLYIADNSTNAGTIYMTDAGVNTNVVVLKTPGKTGNTTVHTSLGSLIVRGSVQTGDLKIWGNDTYMSSGAVVNSIRRWDINGGTLPYNTAPAAPFSGLSSPYLGTAARLNLDLDMSVDGTRVYESINRSSGTDTESVRIYVNNAYTWGSKAASIASGATIDYLRTTRAVRVSPDGKALYVMQDTNAILSVPLDANGMPPTSLTASMVTSIPVYPNAPTVGRELCFDAAGNMYVTSSGRESMRIFSPGGTTVAITGGDLTGTNGTFSVTNAPFGDPYVLFQPQDQIVVLTNAATFRSVAGGTGPFTYQWQKNGTNISGATAANYTIASVQLTDAGDYGVVVTGAFGPITSRSAHLTVAAQPVIFTDITPFSPTVNYGSNISFHASAVGVGPITYQWYFTNGPISGATTPDYTRSITTTNDNNAQVYLVANNSYGSVTSSISTLTVYYLVPAITLQPLDITTIAGTNITLIS
ncbi:MAG: hypothetical protein JWM68_1496, partial [Verrucomicrobiales bacterium]|nr:hypothetical protein [Verrucomicrobiales bacterium]